MRRPRYKRSPWGHKARHHQWSGSGLNERSKPAHASYGYYPSKPSGPGALTLAEREAREKERARQLEESFAERVAKTRGLRT